MVADGDAVVDSRGAPVSKQQAIRGRGKASVAHIDAASNVRPKLPNNPGIRRLVQQDLIAAADPGSFPRTSYRRSRPNGDSLSILNHTSRATASNGPIIGCFTDEARDTDLANGLRVDRAAKDTAHRAVAHGGPAGLALKVH